MLASETVADVSFGEQIGGFGRIVLQFQAQLTDEGAQIFEFISVFGAPHPLQQASVRDGQAGVGHKEMQQIEFLGS